ncbi:hypothetical protein EXIGLDRAFT_784664 [Exidia glandulosa HHB12029]|uniref:Uncharacterized protein n=1 Tax=Exidia glandulosa HHB12029 TaxID=1314781 RepID=A0A166MC26_EXIGL|nr:hypothetical protein EXIGLDRAFT_784664 [Exidia glandulosa HHB12029]
MLKTDAQMIPYFISWPTKDIQQKTQDELLVELKTLSIGRRTVILPKYTAAKTKEIATKIPDKIYYMVEDFIDIIRQYINAINGVNAQMHIWSMTLKIFRRLPFHLPSSPDEMDDLQDCLQVTGGELESVEAGLAPKFQEDLDTLYKPLESFYRMLFGVFDTIVTIENGDSYVNAIARDLETFAERNRLEQLHYLLEL